MRQVISVRADVLVRCGNCGEKILKRETEGYALRNKITIIYPDTGEAFAKCPRCKAEVRVPIALSA